MLVRLARDDRGYATVAAAGVIVGVVSVLVMVVYVGAAVIARHRAQSAADLAALAAAIDHVSGDADACATARELIDDQRSAVVLRRCRTDGTDVVVEVGVPITLGLFGSRDASAAARAGPAE
ncbi:Rv3654c family TadE-like protein [Gordonia polyisoprenivorans]|uniref:Rv3654c family TadE-like protein n=1 Tax=Gordonia polyisoprenivorans TaxID=84595 RepID=UPI000B99E825|nr:Rv3654c family TadE-like protein [Gordonia polyisoprenivorans]OZC33694.1 hypothetical protein CJJ17_20990 [Gordonia polyisoprenivorans]UZF58982.1 flp pilus-assembly TadE/G-like family protein [Gordonia polyisoprenivorans]WCB40021.1 flp pilus-assembly TadE/G-like family protein [Gordonia polyisoprenivorans]